MAPVLKSTSKLLWLAGLRNEPVISYKKVTIGNESLNIFIIISQIYATLPYILYLRENSYLLARIDNPAYAIVGYTSTVLIYIQFVRNKSITLEAIAFLESLISKSQLKIRQYKTTFLNCNLIKFKGTDSMKFFDEVESCDTNSVNRMRKVVQFVFVTLIIQSGIGPLFYAIAGVPDPEKWLAQLQLK